MITFRTSGCDYLDMLEGGFYGSSREHGDYVSWLNLTHRDNFAVLIMGEGDDAAIFCGAHMSANFSEHTRALNETEMLLQPALFLFHTLCIEYVIHKTRTVDANRAVGQKFFEGFIGEGFRRDVPELEEGFGFLGNILGTAFAYVSAKGTS
jgi:hypothetical protein